MTPPNDKDASLGAMKLPPGLTELEFADALLEMARLHLEQEPVDIKGAAAMIKSARQRMDAARREGARIAPHRGE
jgi:hypothetical protein